MPTKRKADGPLGAPNKAYRQGKLFSFFCKQARQQKADASAAPDAAASQVAASAETVDSVHAATATSATSVAVSQSVSSQSQATTTNPDIAKIKLGDRIEVYWPDDDEYYAAKISKAQAHPGSTRFFIKYEDGQEEWIDLSTATFRNVGASSATNIVNKKRGRIQDDDDDDDEAEFSMPDSEDDGSVYQDDKQVAQDDDDDDQWVVSDDDGDGESPSGKPEKLKVVAHKTPARSTAPSTSSSSSFQSSQKTTNTSAATPKQITPTFTQASFSSSNKSTPNTAVLSSSYQSPTLASHSVASSNLTPLTGTPPKYQREVVNPAGSHVHNHLKFLMHAHRRDAQRRPTSHPDYDPRTLLVDEKELEGHCGKLTDGVQQWWKLKAQYFDTVLLFKTGKFYELFHMDADIGVNVCGHCYMKGHIAHSGFPEAAYGKFADMMVRAGYKVCRVEQTETPNQLKERKRNHKGKGSPKVVNREVCSILTAGTRTYCFLDRIDDTADASSADVGPLLAIREVLYDTPSSQEDDQDDDEIQPVCEYGITVVDAVRGTITVGQFADDIRRSRMDTLLLAFQPSEILLEGGQDGASPSLRALIRSLQIGQVENVLREESFPKSNAIDPIIRRQLERQGTVHPWDAEETLHEIHRRGYYPRASKKQEDLLSISRWPPILQAIVEGNANLAISSFGAALFYLQRNLVDMELLSMGLVKAYIPPTSSVAHEKSVGALGVQIAKDIQEEDAIDSVSLNLRSPHASMGDQALNDMGAAPFHSSEDDITNMSLDGTTLMNLEILTNNADKKASGSLWSLINHTNCPHGTRLLRAWLLRPLFRKADIERRTDAVQELVSGSAAVALSEAMAILSKCGDIERLLSRVHSMGVAISGAAANEDIISDIHPSERAVLYETATYTRRMVSDFSSLLNGLRHADQIPEIFNCVDARSGLLNKIVRRTDQGGRFPNMTETLDWFFDNFDCSKARQGQFEPARGIDADFDAACETIESILVDLEHYKNDMCTHHLSPASLARSSWKYINTKADSKDKFLIELPANVMVPAHFIVKGKRGTGAKQVIKYRSSAVEEHVKALDHAYEMQRQRRALGMKLMFSKFDEMRHLWAAAGQATALLDALGSLAKASMHSGYSRAVVLDCSATNESSINVVQGRHPIVEKTLKTGEFVPNDVALGSNGKRILLLSGVNMGGKSTCLRQTCLLSIMAQIGCFVPAESFELTPVDRIYTRLGASDRILMGQSTFFVELAETAAAVRGATRRSLVIMDELGRGTSTFDGTAIASATVKHLVERSKCISLFATHYHSLLDEWRNHPNVLLGHMECVVETGNVTARQEGGADSPITFLYTLGEGVFPKSFGINVAMLAGLPSNVITNASRISADFERQMEEGATSSVVTISKARSIKRRSVEAKESDDWESKLSDLISELN